jgi:hypothetical protein
MARLWRVLLIFVLFGRQGVQQFLAGGFIGFDFTVLFRNPALPSFKQLCWLSLQLYGGDGYSPSGSLYGSGLFLAQVYRFQLWGSATLALAMR